MQGDKVSLLLFCPLILTVSVRSFFQSVCDSVRCATWSSANPTTSAGASLVSSWEVFFDPLDELHTDFCHVVPSQRVLNEFDIHRHLNLNHTHFKELLDVHA